MLITDASNLNTLVDSVHDLWFDIDQVERDFSAGVVTILLYTEPDDLRRNQPPCSMLRISSVDCLLIRDTEHVGYYDIDKIDFEPVARVLTITGCIPIMVKLRIAKLELELRSPL